ncbi:aspartate/glutamate racemase family protein [Vibrio ziniensis]|uniref:Aspartate/glutamate racemase family protein n=1 Tax=Vibrio ziniensis TaxID=2711221 RepID=A0A6G7CMP6_9VIBR|nr:aspartate/glutamate racemase family protein [Vibrio ziniensis]QIH43407.1 aspartate/glutamate racemase family protein [Vibrio ziniensis]
MKTIGMLGGMSWESTVSYYKAINEGVKQSLGGLHSAKIALYSVNFDEIEKLQRVGDWEQAGVVLGEAAKSIQAGGADFLLICTNTMHKVLPQIEQYIDIPVLHIADATANKLLEDGISKVGLIGTAFTMEQDFYKCRISENFGIEVIVPEHQEREVIHRVIYDELCQGQILAESREKYINIIDSLRRRGAEAVILGCTEIALLVEQEHTQVKLYDTTKIHAEQAVMLALAN